MFKHYFEQIDKVEIWPVISLTIFFIFFVGLIIWVFTADKNYIREMRQLPLDDGLIDTQNPENT